jgi:ion channel-forming bestrophin family protein
LLVRPKRSFPGTIFLVRGTSLADIWPIWLSLVAVSALVTWGHEPLGLDRYSLTTLPFTLIGLALSIFLGFRNNACYDRWWEARKLWGQLVNTSRTLARQTFTLVNAEDSVAEAAVVVFQRQMVRRQIAYVVALKAHLRTDVGLEPLRALLPAEEVLALGTRLNRPMWIAQRTGELYRDAWKRGWIATLHLPVFEASLTGLLDVQGGCERIKKTPVPLSYTVLTHRLVGMYCLGLPFGIVNQVGVLTPLVVALISYAFLGLDDVGSQLEDPFEEDPNDLPLSALARTIERDLLQLCGEEALPDEIAVSRGVLL